jgi:hypothetical protein
VSHSHLLFILSIIAMKNTLKVPWE